MNVFGAIPADEAGDGARPAGFRQILRRVALLAALSVSVAIATHGLLESLQPGPEARASLSIDGMSAARGAADADFLDAQAKLISSRDTLRRAATELGVTDASMFSHTPFQERILAALGLGGAGKQLSPEERLTDALAMRFSAVPSGRGRMIDVRFSAGDLDFAIRFLDRVVADYLLLQGTDGGVGARLVSTAVPVVTAPVFSPLLGALMAALAVMGLGGGLMILAGRRRGEALDPPEEAPVVVGVVAPSDRASAGDRPLVSPEMDSEGAAAPSAAGGAATPGVDLARRRRLSVACFGEGDENRRLVDELARDGGFNGARIVVIDASRRTEDRPGLAELLAGEADFADVIQRNATSRAHEIGAGRRPLASLAGDAEAASMLIEALEETYDLVLIDLGRLRADPAFTLFARLSGQLMLTGDADPGAVDTLLAALERRGVKGIVRVAVPAGDMAA